MILYRLLMLAALPVLAVLAARRGGLRERLAMDAVPQGAIWVHGASNGELTSARSVIAGLSARGDRVLVTCNNPTAIAMVTGWGMAGVTARLAPFDAWPVMRGCAACVRWSSWKTSCGPNASCPHAVPCW